MHWLGFVHEHAVWMKSATMKAEYLRVLMNAIRAITYWATETSREHNEDGNGTPMKYDWKTDKTGWNRKFTKHSESWTD